MPSSDPVRISSDLLLVCEGRADEKVLGGLMRARGIAGYQPIPLQGHTNKRAFLKSLALSPHFRGRVPGHGHPVRGLAVVLDAERSAPDTFASLRAALAEAGFAAPERPGAIAEGSPRTGVFLLPDNILPGKIETLCMASVAGDPAWGCLDGFFECVAQRGGALPADCDKARAQAFLATRREPDLPVGLASDKGYWDFANPCFDPPTEFLKTVAG